MNYSVEISETVRETLDSCRLLRFGMKPKGFIDLYTNTRMFLWEIKVCYCVETRELLKLFSVSKSKHS